MARNLLFKTFFYSALACLGPALGLASEHHGIVRFGGMGVPGATVTATHGPSAPIVEKTTSPDLRFVLPEMGEGLFQIPGPCGGQLAGEQGIELLPNPPTYPAAAAE